MKKFLIRACQDLKRGENIDLLVGFFIVFVISSLGICGIYKTEVISAATLFVLGILAVGLLVSRYKMESLYNFDGVHNKIIFHKEKNAELSKEISQATEIWMLGLILRGTTMDNFHVLKRNVANGLKLRTIICDPSCLRVENIVKRFSHGAKATHFIADFEHTINQYKEIEKASSIQGQVQLKLLNFVPSISLYIFPKSKHHGKIFVEIYGYRSLLGSVPKFVISQNDHPEWYDYFIDQYNLMWNDSKKVHFS